MHQHVRGKTGLSVMQPNCVIYFPGGRDSHLFHWGIAIFGKTKKILRHAACQVHEIQSIVDETKFLFGRTPMEQSFLGSAVSLSRPKQSCPEFPHPSMCLVIIPYIEASYRTSLFEITGKFTSIQTGMVWFGIFLFPAMIPKSIRDSNLIK